MDDAASPASAGPGCANRSGIRPCSTTCRCHDPGRPVRRTGRPHEHFPDSAIVRAGYGLAPPKPAAPHEGMTPHGVAALPLMVRNGQE